MGMQIAIDGPAGAGKSTVSKKVAQELGFVYVDTGAMYRAMGLYLMRNNIEISDIEKVKEACNDVDIFIAYEKGMQIVYLNGENVNGLIRTEEAGKMASDCGTVPEVRQKLVELQKEMADTMNVVMEGRDICTSVLPNAQVKIYLTASTKERARRRCQQLMDKGLPHDEKEIEKDIVERDYQDMNRAISPLKQADDALLIDSSDMTIDSVVNVIVTAARFVKNN